MHNLEILIDICKNIFIYVDSMNEVVIKKPFFVLISNRDFCVRENLLIGYFSHNLQWLICFFFFFISLNFSDKIVFKA